MYKQVPQVRRQVLQQLRLVLRHRRQRQVPTTTPAHDARPCRLDALLHLHRRQPHQPPDRGGRPQLHARGLRELGQGRHEPLLPRQHGGPQPRLPPEGRRGREEVSMNLKKGRGERRLYG